MNVSKTSCPPECDIGLPMALTLRTVVGSVKLSVDMISFAIS